MRHLLFICSQNRLRSPTAQAVFSEFEGVEALSAGLNHDAEIPVSADLLEWADEILVMEQSHKRKLSKRFGAFLKDKKVRVLGIPDDFEYMQLELVTLLKNKVLRLVRL